MTLSPLTKNKDVDFVYAIPSSRLIEDWQKAFQIDIVKELSGCKEISLYQCNQTKLRFFEPSNAVGSARLYEQLQKFDWFYMPQKWEHEVALQNLSDCRDVLEVGCAFGSFVETGLQAGLKIRGIELNNDAVRVAQSKGLPVDSVDLKEYAKDYPASLDALCSFQVLEHVPNPSDFLQWSIQSLRKDGKLILCVPNADSFLKHQYNLLDMPPHHMLQWSEASFESLEKLFPVKLEKMIREPLADYHVSSYLSSYSNYFRSASKLNKLLFNKYTLSFYERVLRLGLRRFLTGQSLYVQFRKLS